MKLEYRRSLALSNIPVSSTFRYRDIFQILPAEDNAPRPPALLNHHPLVIEYLFTIDESKRTFPDGQVIPQWIKNNDEAGKRLKELTLLLTTFSCDRIFVYSSNQSWFYPMGTKDKEPESKNVQWGQQSYFYIGFESSIKYLTDTDTDTNKIKLTEPNEYFNRYGKHTDQEFDLPGNVNHLFDAYFSLGKDAKKSFLSSASLFNQGTKLWSEHPSLSFVSLVSSLETLIYFDHVKDKVEKCPECGQERHRVVQKFREFFNSYGSPAPEFKKYALKVYKYRSNVLHRGELFLGEVYPQKFGSIESFEDDELRRSVLRTCRICLVNWLIKNSNEGKS
jgi:hypothetical protein